eukprot:UN09193
MVCWMYRARLNATGSTAFFGSSVGSKRTGAIRIEMSQTGTMQNNGASSPSSVKAVSSLSDIGEHNSCRKIKRVQSSSAASMEGGIKVPAFVYNSNSTNYSQDPALTSSVVPNIMNELNDRVATPSPMETYDNETIQE